MVNTNSALFALMLQCGSDDRTKDFYRSLGVELEFTDVATFVCGMGNFPTSNPTIMMVSCDELVEVAESFKASGVKVIRPLEIGLMGASMIVEDPDGRPVLISEGMEKVKSRLPDMCSGEPRRPPDLSST